MGLTALLTSWATNTPLLPLTPLNAVKFSVKLSYVQIRILHTEKIKCFLSKIITKWVSKRAGSVETSSNQALSAESNVYNIFLHFLGSVDVCPAFNFFQIY